MNNLPHLYLRPPQSKKIKPDDGLLIHSFDEKRDAESIYAPMKIGANRQPAAQLIVGLSDSGTSTSPADDFTGQSLVLTLSNNRALGGMDL